MTISALSLYFFFVLIILKTKVPIACHTKYQPNIPSGSGEKINFIGVAIFNYGSHLGFSTKQNSITLKTWARLFKTKDIVS